MDFYSSNISEAVIRRLTNYLHCLRLSRKKGRTLLTSSDISGTCGLKPSTIRKDLAQFGAYGVRGQGYDIEELTKHLNKILGIDRKKDVVLVGAGNLGTAMIKHPGFMRANFRFAAAFDNDPGKIGTLIGDTEILDVRDLNAFIKKKHIGIMVLTVPSPEAAAIVDDLDPAHVRGILNFTSEIFPRKKHGMYIHNIDLARELEIISFCMKHCLS